MQDDVNKKIDKNTVLEIENVKTENNEKKTVNEQERSHPDRLCSLENKLPFTDL